MVKWAKGQLRGKAVIKSVARLIVRLIVGLVIRLVVRLVVKAVIGVVIKSVAVIGEKIIKWDKEALDALFNKTIKYLIINNYISIINKFYI